MKGDFLMNRIVWSFALVLFAGLMSTPAQAMRCDYCGTSGGEWSCREITISSSGTMLSSGTFCTYFYSGPSGDTPDTWGDFWDNTYGGGRGRFNFNYTKTIPNFPNPYPSTCTSDVGTRYEHAESDVTKYNVAMLASGGSVTPAGSLVKVLYDDGGSEVWNVISPYATSQVNDIPVPNSLRCPQ